jgi:glycosyltransferase involved in cell wall biosynthesis
MEKRLVKSLRGNEYRMKLSILMITYNHQNYIKQALDSILMQVTNFEYEIVVGEDCSTDNTRKILCEYQLKYPDKIRLLLPDQNLGMMKNFIQTYQACQGEYIAILEGDDYWTCSNKLQKQVDFLNNNPDFTICFHNANYLWEIDDHPPHGLLCKESQKEVSTLEDLLVENFIPTLTSMFRNRQFGAFPDWFLRMKFGDWPLHILNAEHGKIGYLNESMASYRVHSCGVASVSRTDKRKYLEHIKSVIAFYEAIGRHLSDSYKAFIQKRLSEQYCLLGKVYEELGQFLLACFFYLKFIMSSPPTDVLKRVAGRLNRGLR